MKSLRSITAALLLAIANTAFAGVDLSGTVTAVQVALDGSLYFAINSNSTSTAGVNHWAGLSMSFRLGIPATRTTTDFERARMLALLTCDLSDVYPRTGD